MKYILLDCLCFFLKIATARSYSDSVRAFSSNSEINIFCKKTFCVSMLSIDCVTDVSIRIFVFFFIKAIHSPTYLCYGRKNNHFKSAR